MMPGMTSNLEIELILIHLFKEEILLTHPQDLDCPEVQEVKQIQVKRCGHELEVSRKKEQIL
jgi:hypothetical protein